MPSDEPIIFQICRGLSVSAGLSFAEVEATLYGALPPSEPTVLGRKSLVKNGVASKYEPPKVSPLARRVSVAEKMLADAEVHCPITDEKHEQYAYEFEERVSVYVYEVLPERCGSKVYHGGECCAHHVVISEVGCIEFWAEPKREDAQVISVPTQRPVGHCTRCESVGHTVAFCPFSVADMDVKKMAQLRRERRAGRAAAA